MGIVRIVHILDSSLKHKCIDDHFENILGKFDIALHNFEVLHRISDKASKLYMIHSQYKVRFGKRKLD